MKQGVKGKMGVLLGSHRVDPNPLEIRTVDLGASITRPGTAFVGSKHSIRVHCTIQAAMAKLEVIVSKALGPTPVVELPDGKLS